MSNERKPHKYAEAIKAWADGREIQFRVDDDDTWSDISSPTWNGECQYRVKPEPVKVRYRVALCQYGPESYPKMVRNDDHADALENNNSEFVRWITDWIEVEVPQ